MAGRTCTAVSAVVRAAEASRTWAASSRYFSLRRSTYPLGSSSASRSSAARKAARACATGPWRSATAWLTTATPRASSPNAGSRSRTDQVRPSVLSAAARLWSLSAASVRSAAAASPPSMATRSSAASSTAAVRASLTRYAFQPANTPKSARRPRTTASPVHSARRFTGPSVARLVLLIAIPQRDAGPTTEVVGPAMHGCSALLGLLDRQRRLGRRRLEVANLGRGELDGDVVLARLELGQLDVDRPALVVGLVGLAVDRDLDDADRLHVAVSGDLDLDDRLLARVDGLGAGLRLRGDAGRVLVAAGGLGALAREGNETGRHHQCSDQAGQVLLHRDSPMSARVGALIQAQSRLCRRQDWVSGTTSAREVHRSATKVPITTCVGYPRGRFMTQMGYGWMAS